MPFIDHNSLGAPLLEHLRSLNTVEAIDAKIAAFKNASKNLRTTARNVERRVDPEDRRSRRLRATRRGGDLRKRLRPRLLAAQERVLKPLAPAERASLIDMLVRVLEANDAYARPGNGRRKPRKFSTS
jgi:hypothetical protein